MESKPNYMLLRIKTIDINFKISEHSLIKYKLL